MTQRWIEPGEDFARLFETFESSAWRWEAQTVYIEPGEAQHWQRWRDGQPDDLEWMRSWLDLIRSTVAGGKSFGRVRVFSEPPTEYLRWQAEITPHNVAAGEDIRALTEAQARDLRLPTWDFWLFDDCWVAWLHFGDNGLAGASLTDDSATVARCRTWRERALRHAVPFPEYSKAVLSDS